VRTALILPIAGMLTLTSAFAQQEPRPRMPLRTGVRWVYRGKVEWTVGTEVKSAPVRWTTEVVATFKGRGSLVAVIRDFPRRLAWWSPAEPHHYDIVLSTGQHLYDYRAEELGTDDRSAAIAVATRIARGAVQMPDPSEHLFMEFPLVVGKRWGGDTDRDDGMYCWAVVGMKSKPIRVPGVRSGHRYAVYSMVYRTNPDHALIDFAPSVGITGYIYGHHGTVASAEVTLVALHVPDTSADRFHAETKMGSSLTAPLARLMTITSSG